MVATLAPRSLVTTIVLGGLSLPSDADGGLVPGSAAPVPGVHGDGARRSITTHRMALYTNRYRTARNTILRTVKMKTDTGSAPSELENGVADRDPIALLERALRHGRFVDPRAVRRAKVGDDEPTVLAAYLGVPPAHTWIGHHHIGFGLPADDDSILRQRKGLPGGSTAQQDELGLQALPGSCCRLDRCFGGSGCFIGPCGGRGRSFHQRGLAGEFSLLECWVDVQRDLGRAHQVPSALVGAVTDDLLQLATKCPLRLVELLAVRGRQHEGVPVGDPNLPDPDGLVGLHQLEDSPGKLRRLDPGAEGLGEDPLDHAF